MTIVRPATPQDGETLLSLIRALADYEKLPPPNPEAQQRLLRDIFGAHPRLEAFLAETDGQMAGYALILETYSSFLALPTLYLEDIFVLPAWRGKGAGAALFREMVRLARDRGCGRMEWAVLDWNTPAQEFYARFGAVHRSDWMPMRLVAADFERILQPPSKKES